MTDDELEDYLVNWGRWSRESRGPGRSPMARLIAEAGAMSGISKVTLPLISLRQFKSIVPGKECRALRILTGALRRS